MKKRPLKMNEDEELVEFTSQKKEKLFNLGYFKIIEKELDKIIPSLSKELKVTELDISIGIWHLVRFFLIKLNKKKPKYKIKKLMKHLSKLHSKHIDEE